MPRPRKQVPTVETSRGYVRARYSTDAGRQVVVLGKADNPVEWKGAYARLCDRLVRDPNAVLRTRGEMLCSELALEYLSQYRSTLTRRQIVKRALTLWAGQGAPFTLLPVRDFKPQHLEELQRYLIGVKNPKHKRPYTATTINEYVGIVRSAFRFAVRRGWVEYDRYESLSTVPGVSRDREGLHPVTVTTGVPLDTLRAIRPFMSRPTRAILDLQLLTGTRPGVLFGMTPADIIRGGVADLPRIGVVDLDQLPGQPWAFCPMKHKTARLGHSSVILFGPEARDVITPFLDGRPADRPLFSPSDASRDRWNDERRERDEWNRLVAVKRHELGVVEANAAGFIIRRGSNKKRVADPKRRPGDRYDRTSYRNAVIRACRAAGVKEFTPYRVRNTALQLAELATDLDGAAAIAGHSSVNTSKRYTKQNIRRAALAAAGVAGLVTEHANAEVRPAAPTFELSSNA